MKKKIIVIGAGGFASEIIDTIEYINKHYTYGYDVLGYVYEGANESKGTDFYGYPILGDFDYIEELKKPSRGFLNGVEFVCAVGTPELKKRLGEKVKSLGGKFSSIIHPTAFISKGTSLGEGVIIQGQCILAGIDIKVGNFVTINDNFAIGHGTTIGDYTHINPNVNVSGNAQIGREVFVGVKSTILKVNIGDRAVIGACALVTKDVPQDTMAKGIPAKLFEKSEKRY